MGQLPAGDWLSVTEAAELLGLTRRRVHDFIKDGRLPHKPAGNSFLVLRADVMKLKATPRPPGPKKK